LVRIGGVEPRQHVAWQVLPCGIRPPDPANCRLEDLPWIGIARDLDQMPAVEVFRTTPAPSTAGLRSSRSHRRSGSFLESGHEHQCPHRQS
jgi:hypothetical protein